MKDKLNPPQSGTADTAFNLMKGAIGSVPLAGPFAAEFIATLVSPSLERRRDEWMQVVADELRRLADRGKVDLEQLKANQEFVDILIQATSAALRTRHAEKREALRNAVLNTTLGASPDEVERAMFLHLIEQFTPLHIQMLQFYRDPAAWLDRMGVPRPDYEQFCYLENVTFHAFPSLRKREPLFEQLCRDMTDAGMFKGSMNVALSADAWKLCYATDRGKAFLNFISKPASLR